MSTEPKNIGVYLLYSHLNLSIRRVSRQIVLEKVHNLQTNKYKTWYRKMPNICGIKLSTYIEIYIASISHRFQGWSGRLCILVWIRLECFRFGLGARQLYISRWFSLRRWKQLSAAALTSGLLFLSCQSIVSWVTNYSSILPRNFSVNLELKLQHCCSKVWPDTITKSKSHDCHPWYWKLIKLHARKI